MLLEDIKKTQMYAMKDHDKIKEEILKIVVAKAMLVKIDKREKNEELTDDDVIKVIGKIIKELEEEISDFTKANRSEIVEKLNLQKDILNEYMPKKLTIEEIKAEIDKLEDKSMPSIMKHFKVNFVGKVDMKIVSDIAKELNN